MKVRSERVANGWIQSHRGHTSPLEGILMTTLLQDVRYGLRLLWKSPGFTIVAVLSLALGVGANTAIFSIVNAVLLRSLPFSHPDRLVKIVANNRGVGAQDIGFSVPELDDLRLRTGVFEQVSAINAGDTNLTGAERPQRHQLAVVSPNYFSMLGATPQIGRLFGPQDFALGFAEAAVISDSLWAKHFRQNRKKLHLHYSTSSVDYATRSSTLAVVIAVGRKRLPASVSTTLFASRSNSFAPSSSSSALICAVTFDCTVFTRSAVRVKFSSSASARKISSCRTSIALRFLS